MSIFMQRTLRPGAVVSRATCASPLSPASGRTNTAMAPRHQHPILHGTWHARPVVTRAFFKGKGDDEAAKEALRQAFEGKKDPWKLDEERAKKRGGGGDGGDGGSGGGGGGGGRGGFGGGFDPSDFGDSLMRWLRNFMKAVAAAGAFFGVIIAFTFWEPLLKLVATIFRTILRLDARNPKQVETTAVQADLGNKNELGDVEEAVIGQWAGDDHPDVGASDDDDE